MKKFLLSNSTDKLEYAAILAGEAWMTGILERVQSPYLELSEPTEEECTAFLSQFVTTCSEMLQVHENMYKKYGKSPCLTISHINENTTCDIIANSVRSAHIPLKAVPSYSYSKFYFTHGDTILVDLNTTDKNKRVAFAVTQTNDHSNYSVERFEPEHGVELPDCVYRMGKADEYNM